MRDTSLSTKVTKLLASLFDAGWELYAPKLRSKARSNTIDSVHSDSVESLILRRTCMVLGISYDPNKDQLTFMPVVNSLSKPKDGSMDLYDAVLEPDVIEPSYHGLVPLLVDFVAARHGLLDPIRFTLSDHSNMSDTEFLRMVYAQVIARDTADWLGITQAKARQRIDADSDTLEAIRGALYHAPDVLPDPVPMAAAIGITLTCWRHTEIENLHVGNPDLTDVVMAKLNVATTRGIRPYITTNSIDWDGVTGLLLDPERPATNDRNISNTACPHWPTLVASIDVQIKRWQHVESVVGPKAAIRLLSAMGSIDYTSRWWGNGWWRTLADHVFEHVSEHFPELLPKSQDEFAPFDLASDLREHPDTLPDEVLSALIDPPDGKGLRYAPVPRPKVYVLRVRRSEL